MRRATPPRPAARLAAAAASVATAAALLLAPTLSAQPVFVSTGDPDGRMAMASRPASPGRIEIEAADDFILTNATRLDLATFTGLLTGGISPADIGLVRVEIYRIFPKDSDVGRTSGPPTFSTPLVPTRVNSPSDVAFAERESGGGGLSFVVSSLGQFTASNSVLNGINPRPNQATGGEGSVTGEEVQFSVTFTTPLVLPADHYFLVPQVGVSSNGEFYWLSAAKPIVAPGTPFSPDLQTWIRDEDLAPDWLRVGTDIVGGTPASTFNASFSLSGQVVPEPTALALLAGGLAALAAIAALGAPGAIARRRRAA